MRPLVTAVRARRARGHGDEGGFGVVEVAIAVAILTFVLIGTEVGAVDAMNTAMSVREHSVASGLIAATASEAEALPFTTLQAGLDPTADNLASDPRIVASTRDDHTTYTLSLNGAAVAACSTTSPAAPLVPHVTTVVAGVTYKVAAYPTVTSAACGSNPQLVTLVVVVTWPSPTGGTLQLVGVTQIAAP